MRSIIIGVVALVELVVFLALTKAAFEIFNVLAAITFSATVGTVALSVIMGIMRVFRMIDRREFMKVYAPQT